MKKRVAKILWNPLALVILLSFCYFFVFYLYSLQRLQMLWASYFDLGIMHQTVWNTYRAIQTLDPSRLLELTDPHGSGLQIYRMAIHADYLLAALAPLYFIHSGPETLLFVQTAALASGAIAIYIITCVVQKIQRCHPEFISGSSSLGKIPNQVRDDKNLGGWIMSIVFPVLYLMNFAVQRTNLYEFHAVTLATPLILWMYAAYIYKRYWLALLLATLAISTKEQVGFSIGIFLLVEGAKSIYNECKYGRCKFLLASFFIRNNFNLFLGIPRQREFPAALLRCCHGEPVESMTCFHDMSPVRQAQGDRYPAVLLRGCSFIRVFTFLLLSFFSFLYVLITVFYIMPAFRSGSDHFALSYFTNDNDVGVFRSISIYSSRLLSLESLKYVVYLFGALAFLPVLSIYTLPAIPDLLINILSESSNMRNFYYHYTAVMTPWLFVSSIYVSHRLLKYLRRTEFFYIFIFLLLLFCSIFSYLESPLPYSLRGGPLAPFKYANELMDIHMWQQVLSDDRIPVSSTGQFAPYLSGRRYFYDFGKNYIKADYVMIRRNEVYNYPDKNVLIPVYENLMVDQNFKKIYTRGGVEVYKKVMPL